MSNQMFYFILFLGIGLIAGCVIFMSRAFAAEQKNVALAEKISDSENRNALLNNELSMFRRNLR